MEGWISSFSLFLFLVLDFLEHFHHRLFALNDFTVYILSFFQLSLPLKLVVGFSFVDSADCRLSPFFLPT
jgi:hypothetical protein